MTIEGGKRAALKYKQMRRWVNNLISIEPKFNFQFQHRWQDI